MARFALFKVPGETRNVLVNLDKIDWIGGSYQAHLHFGDDHIVVDASIDSVQGLLETEFGNVLDGTPDA